MHLARFPRVRLFPAPTPLEPLTNLTRHLGGPGYGSSAMIAPSWRPAATRFASLNSSPATPRPRARTISSPRARCSPTMSARPSRSPPSWACSAPTLLEHRIETNDANYLGSGNVLLDRLMGAKLEYRRGGTDMNAAAEQKGEELRAAGAKPYVIPGGGSNRVGALGYVSCAQELMQQADEMGLKIDRLVTATGSAGTQAGLVAGLVGTNAGIQVLGIGVRAPKDRQEANVYNLAQEVADYVGLRGGIPRDTVEANCDYIGPGYGQPTEGMAEAVRMLAQHEGILLDPVYSGKAMAGLIDLVRKGYFDKNETVVFLHTGGAVGLFGYTAFFDRHLAA